MAQMGQIGQNRAQMGFRMANIGPKRVKLGQTRAQMGQNDRNETEMLPKMVQKGQIMVKTNG